jgi:hypothetical protein
LLGRIPEGGQEEAVDLPEAISDRLGRGMEARGRRLLGLVGLGERILPEDHSEAQDRNPSLQPRQSRLDLDLLDERRHPLTVLLR